MNHAIYEVVENSAERVLIKDLGPWHQYMTITNDAEHVVATLRVRLDGRRLFYIDSLGDEDELLVVDGKFAGFQGGPR